MKVCGSESLASSAVHNRFHDRLAHFRVDDFVEKLCFLCRRDEVLRCSVHPR